MSRTYQPVHGNSGNANARKDQPRESVLTIRLPREMKSRFVKHAQTDGKKLSEWVLEACQRKIEMKTVYAIGDLLNGVFEDGFASEAAASAAIDEIVKDAIKNEVEYLLESLESDSWRMSPAEQDYAFFERLEDGEPVEEVAADRIRAFHFVAKRDFEDDEWLEVGNDD